MIKIAHECPISIFKDVQEVTDYDYFLVHLFEENPEYLRLAKESVASGRETILDNSIFELGTAFDMAKFADWVTELRPTYYIIPDVLDDADGTVLNAEGWCWYFRSRVPRECKSIAVCQGRTYEDLRYCYSSYRKLGIDKIAFSFDSAYYEQLCPHPNKLVSWMMGRVSFLSKMVKDGIIDTSKKHHLLGCGLPLEFQFYNGKEEFSWIDSVDTSNPVVAGIKEDAYDYDMGLRHKDSVKLYTLINMDLSEEQRKYVMHNIKYFRYFCNSPGWQFN